MAKYAKKKGPDAGQNVRQIAVPMSEAELARIAAFQHNVAMPGTPRTAVMRFLLLTGLEYLEEEKKGKDGKGGAE